VAWKAGCTLSEVVKAVTEAVIPSERLAPCAIDATPFVNDVIPDVSPCVPTPPLEGRQNIPTLVEDTHCAARNLEFAVPVTIIDLHLVAAGRINATPFIGDAIVVLTARIPTPSAENRHDISSVL